MRRFLLVLAARLLGLNGWMIAAPALLFLYYLIAWIAVGRDPKPGPLVTRYEPPLRMSAAAMRYVITTGTDGRSLAAVIAQLAVKGCLRAEPQDGKYKLSRLMSDRATEAQLAPEERRLLAVLFEDGPVMLFTPALEERNSAQQGRYVANIHQELRKRLDGKYFTRNAGVIALGVLATFPAGFTLALLAHGRDPAAALFLTMWILFVGLILGLIVEVGFLPAVRNALRVRRGWIKVLPGTAAIAVFAGVIALMFQKLWDGVSPAFSLAILALLAVNLGCAPWMRRRTREGRQLLDEIAGFRLFLEKVEQDRIDKLNPADEMLQPGEEFLAYAIALEVREAWGDHLSQTFFAATAMR